MTSPTPLLRVLTTYEDGEWIAHLLEMDLVGTGQTAEEAQADLKEAFEAQVSFCMQNDLDPFFPAPQHLFDVWERIQRQELCSFVKETPVPDQSPQRATIVSPKTTDAPARDGWFSQPCFG